MPFQLSPGVAVVEKDFSSIVPAVSSSAGAFCGPFAWGPVEDPVRVSSETDLVARFGAPNNENFQSFFTAANFLAYANNMLITRTDADGLRNAVVKQTGSVQPNQVALVSAGFGYTNASVPTVTFSAPETEGGTVATGTVTYNDVNYIKRTVTGISGLAAGSGYTTATVPTVTFSTPANALGQRATGTVNYTDDGSVRTITGVSIVDPGFGYTSSDTITITFSTPNEAGTTATAIVVYADDNTAVNRQITGVVITSGGSGYVGTPTVTIAPPSIGVAATATVSGVTVSGVKIKNISDYLDNFNTGGGSYGEFAAKFPGIKGNGVRVVMLDAGAWNSASTSADIKAYFNGAPGTSSFAESRGLADDELHIVIFDTPTGTFSGVANTVLEKYSFVSKLSDARRSDGSNNYYKSVINSQSKYIWWMDHTAEDSYSEFASVDVVDNAVKATAAITAGTRTITVADSRHFTQLAAFKAFFDAAVDKTSRKIQVSGTTLNNGIYTLTNVQAVLNEQGTIEAYTISVVEALNTENVTTMMISSVEKNAWGIPSTVAENSIVNRFKVLKNKIDVRLSGGVDDFSSSDGNIQNAYALLTNAEQYDISLIPLGNVTSTTANWVLSNVAEVRKDCIVFISPNADGDPITSTGSTATDAIVAYRNATNISSSYAVIDSGWKYQYDRYNDQYRWIPLNGDIAGLCARTDYTADPWYSPGGFTRGQIKNVVKLAFNPNQSDRDVLYAAGVNPVVSFPGQGVILYGDKTMLAKPSAFDRINVRRLFIVLEKAIAIAAKYQLFEFNDSFTRAQFKNLVEPFLRDVQGRRGVTDFRVKCDETNNSGEVIDRNEFVADIFIKPNRSINFITLNFVAARSSVSFEEIGA